MRDALKITAIVYHSIVYIVFSMSIYSMANKNYLTAIDNMTLLFCLASVIALKIFILIVYLFQKRENQNDRYRKIEK